MLHRTLAGAGRVAAAAVLFVGLALAASSSTASAATWPPAATVTQDGDTYTLTVAGEVATSCAKSGTYVDVTAEPGGLSGSDGVPASGGEFSVVFTGLSSPGPYEVTATIVDGTANPQCPDSTVVTSDAPPVWTDDVLASALTLGTPYADDVSASGSPTPTYSVLAGALPTGLSLDTATGAVTGTPLVLGSFEFTLAATNSAGQVTQDFTLTVVAPNVAPTWTDDTVAGTVTRGTAYADGVSADGLPEPTYDIVAGALPPGVTLDGVTGAITGTPTAPGSYGFTVRARNVAGEITAVLSIQVTTPAGTPTPNPGPSGPAAPTPGPAVGAGGAARGATTGGTLPVTGAATPELAAAGLFLLGAGAGLVRASRRRLAEA